jgi:dienelactone hydrolase
VIATDAAGLDFRPRPAYDLWLPSSGEVAPLVILVHGPVSVGPRPREWPVYRGYGSLLAESGLAAAVTDLDYTRVDALSEPIAQLDEVAAAVRDEPGVDGERAVVWAFSGGARLLSCWIEDPPNWLRGVSLTYPIVPVLERAQVPIVLTRVGLERAAVQRTIEQLLAFAPDAQIIDVPHGRHGFDALDHTDESRQAVNAGVAAVSLLLS